MKVVRIQESLKEEHLDTIRKVFKRKKRPITTPIHHSKVCIKKQG